MYMTIFCYICVSTAVKPGGHPCSFKKKHAVQITKHLLKNQKTNHSNSIMSYLKVWIRPSGLIQTFRCAI